MIASVDESAILPRQAICCSDFWVSSGRRVELPDHQVDDIVCVGLGANAIEIPGPARSILIETEQSLFSQRREELNGEKRIAGSLLVHQLRERRGALDSQRRASAINCPSCPGLSGASVISVTFRPRS